MSSVAPLAFVASDRRELEPWVTRWESSRTVDLPVHWARAGTWRGHDVVAVANGVGAHRAAETAAAIQADVHGIFSIGTGGALDPSLAIGDVIIAGAVTDGSTIWTAADPRGPAARSGLVYSSACIARTVEEKRKLNQSGAILVEMEAAGLARIAEQMAVPFYCIKIVSDLADEAFFIDFQSCIMADGRFGVSRLIMQALRNPLRGFPELLRLQRRTAAAAKKLGDFLAECNF